MRVTIIGTHGIPARYGGFETFVAHLVDACAKAGISVRVINEKDNPIVPCPGNVEIVSSSFNKSSSPLRFYHESLKLASIGSDIILCCGVGGAFFYSKYSKSNIKIITNVDGLEHLRRKYSRLQRMVIYFLQFRASRHSNFLIADSKEIWGYWINRFPDNKGRMRIISYGADKCLPFNESVLADFRLKKNEYFLIIARLVPENYIEEIISAFKQYIGRKKLVIVGAVDKSNYAMSLKRIPHERIMFTGGIYDKNILDSLRQGCFMYIHGHSIGGTNPSLLEAMAAGCACLCHDNVFNLEVTAGSQIYFHSSYDLAIMLNLLEHKSHDLDSIKMKGLERVQQIYNWDKINSAYIELFKQLHDSGEWKSDNR